MDYNKKRSFSVKLLSNFVLPLCVADAGPQSSSLYEYIELKEIVGKDRCKNVHVFARKPTTFFRDHNGKISSYLHKEVSSGNLSPVNRLTKPSDCEMELPLFSMGIPESS